MIGNIKKVGSDIMFHAITHANVHDVIALLNDNEVDVNCTNVNGQTPLHVSDPLCMQVWDESCLAAIKFEWVKKLIERL